MLKRVIWAFIHTNKLNSSIDLLQAVKHPLNFLSQEVIKEFVSSEIPEKNIDKLDLSKVKDRKVIDEEEFKKGAEEAYKVVLSDFTHKADFVSTSYCTPQLSFTLNFLNFRMRNIGIDVPHRFCENTPRISSKIIGEWFEMSETRSNNKILGLWDAKHIKKEILSGFMGPEVTIMNNEEDDITYVPIKQTVRLQYNIVYDREEDSSREPYERIDVFDWERSLSCPEEDEEWTVANINSLLLI